MIKPFNYSLLILFSIISIKTIAQNKQAISNDSLSFQEYIAFVKMHHPLAMQANLILSIGEANLLKARGGFDPKVEIDFDRKKFKKTEYFDQFNTTFKIPTWYGIELKANFEQNTGAYLNPNLTVPDEGLYSAGVSFSLAQGFLINERMATLKKAKFFREQTKADRDLLINNLLFDASIAYFRWLEATKEQLIFKTFLENASTRLKALERSVELGEQAQINIVEARIILQNRKLEVEVANLKRKKTTLLVSNYLWINGIPMDLRENINPIKPEVITVKEILPIQVDTSQVINNHPKILSFDAKINSINIDKKLKLNKLLPKVDLQYNFLTPKLNQISSFNTFNYKAFFNVSFPIFLRKERGDLKLTKLKLKDASFDRKVVYLEIKNKIDIVNAEINSLTTQNNLINAIVLDYKTMIKAEERKFSLGESSLFLINSREQKLIDAQLKENKIIIKQLESLAKLYNTFGQSI